MYNTRYLLLMQKTLKNHTVIYYISVWACAVFYVIAGINHFLATDAYASITPQWLPEPRLLIFLSGAAEMLLGLLLLPRSTRKIAAILIVLMLVVFIPIHIDMIQRAPFMLGNFMITKLIAWIRLPMQLLLILWAAFYIKNP